MPLDTPVCPCLCARCTSDLLDVGRDCHICQLLHKDSRREATLSHSPGPGWRVRARVQGTRRNFHPYLEVCKLVVGEGVLSGGGRTANAKDSLWVGGKGLTPGTELEG